MNTFFALIAVIGGALATLVAFQIVPLEKYIDPGEAQDWYDKYGKLIKILGPVALVIGLILLIF